MAKLLQLDKLPPQSRASRLRMKPIVSRVKSVSPSWARFVDMTGCITNE